MRLVLAFCLFFPQYVSCAPGHLRRKAYYFNTPETSAPAPADDESELLTEIEQLEESLGLDDYDESQAANSTSTDDEASDVTSGPVDDLDVDGDDPEMTDVLVNETDLVDNPDLPGNDTATNSSIEDPDDVAYLNGTTRSGARPPTDDTTSQLDGVEDEGSALANETSPYSSGLHPYSPSSPETTEVDPAEANPYTSKYGSTTSATSEESFYSSQTEMNPYDASQDGNPVGYDDFVSGGGSTGAVPAEYDSTRTEETPENYTNTALGEKSAEYDISMVNETPTGYDGTASGEAPVGYDAPDESNSGYGNTEPGEPPAGYDGLGSEDAPLGYSSSSAEESSAEYGSTESLAGYDKTKTTYGDSPVESTNTAGGESLGGYKDASPTQETSAAYGAYGEFSGEQVDFDGEDTDDAEEEENATIEPSMIPWKDQEWANKTPKEVADLAEAEALRMMEDKYVPLIVIAMSLISTAFTLFVAQQMVENPNGIIAKFCRCMVAISRILCFPLRLLLSCCCFSSSARSRNRDRRTHEVLRSRSGEFS